ncbi:MAG: MFS transporter [Pedobacter sp.]|jgi:fucose permease
MKKGNSIVALMLLIFFVISLLQNMLGPLIPEIIDDFNLNLTLAGFLPFSFFIAYAVISIPSGFLLEKYKEKVILLIAFSISFTGAFLFATNSNFTYALISLFLMGSGVAMLQVAINPLLRVAGGEKHFAFNSVLAQLIFGSASFISPKLYTYFVQNLQDSIEPKNGIIKLFALVVPENLPWISLYWVLVIVTLLMIVIIAVIRIPKVELSEDERIGHKNNIILLFKDRIVILYFIGIIAYVGTEQGIANWISKFLLNYHEFDPQTIGATVVSNFWGLMTVGCLLGLFLLKIFDSQKVLIIFSIAAIVSLTFGLCGPGKVALIAFPLVGFFASVMWSIIFSLALNSVSEHHGAFSGILCTGISGGAIVPVIIGVLGNLFGLRFGMFFLYITLGFILSIGFWAKPLISNETIKGKRDAVKLLAKDNGLIQEKSKY